MKKSLFWRTILILVVILLWGYTLFPSTKYMPLPWEDLDYIATFKETVEHTDYLVEQAVREDIEQEVRKDDNTLEAAIDEAVDLKIEEMSPGDLQTRMDDKRETLQKTIGAVLAKAEEVKQKNADAVDKSRKAHLDDPSVELVRERSLESIILDICSGNIEVKNVTPPVFLRFHVPMLSKEEPSNSDIVYYVRNKTRGKIDLGLDLQGGTEFTLKFDPKAVPDDKEPEQARDQIIEILKNRIDPQGVREVEIRPNGPSSITLRTPSTDPAEINNIREIMNTQGKLSFHIVHKDNEQYVNSGNVPQGYKMMPMRERGENDQIRSIVVRSQPEGVTGEHVERAGPSRTEFGEWYVFMEFNATGGKEMFKTTSNNIGERMAIVLDGVVFSAPTIQSSISSRGQITGNFNQEEARRLATVLESGSLPVEAYVDSETTMNPTLGKEFIRKGVFAAGIGMALVILFMVGYYRLAGIIAIIALAINIHLILGSLPLVHAALTLPGIAGIVLTIGMAVDANVLIFERIREELNKGKTIATSVKNGYSRAFYTILDANLTTLFTAFFLYTFGTGPIRGFAVTLSLGIVASMFTALFVTRCIFDALIEYNLLKSPKLLHTRINVEGAEAKSKPEIQFVAYRKVALLFSLAIVIGSIAVFGIRGRGALSTDFTGGSVITMQYDKAPSVDEINTFLSEKGYKDSRVVYKAQLVDVEIGELSAEDKARDMGAVISKLLNDKFSEANFRDPNISTVGSLIGSEFKWKAIKSIVFALIAIIAYISFRFEFGYALGAVAALAHDVAICTGVFLLWGGMERSISLPVIAALLTIIGYSLNDTIVVFDRIRENMEFYRKKRGFLEIVNSSVNQTLSRTLLTSITTLLVVVILYLFGGGAINDFALVMTAGVIVGTYSSIFIATPVMIFFHQKLVGDKSKATASSASGKQVAESA